MQQFDENNIKKAIDNWENTPSGIGFNKSKLLNKLELNKKPSIALTLLRIAAVVAILLLSASVYSNLKMNKQLDKTNRLLLSAQQENELKISRLTDSILILSTSKKVEYITQIKEIPVETTPADNNAVQNEHFTQLQLENMSLKKSLETLSLATTHLNDSIESLMNNMKLIEDEYQLVINDLQKKKSFEINFDQELIAANTTKQAAANQNNSEEKLKVKLGKSASRTAPIRRNFSFR